MSSKTGRNQSAPARTYTLEYKIQAVKLAREVGNSKAADELGVPKGTLGGWMHNAKHGGLDTGRGTQTPETALTQAAEIQRLRAENKRIEKENKQLREHNEFLEEASAQSLCP